MGGGITNDEKRETEKISREEAAWRRTISLVIVQ